MISGPPCGKTKKKQNREPHGTRWTLVLVGWVSVKFCRSASNISCFLNFVDLPRIRSGLYMWYHPRIGSCNHQGFKPVATWDDPPSKDPQWDPIPIQYTAPMICHNGHVMSKKIFHGDMIYSGSTHADIYIYMYVCMYTCYLWI